ncbi:syntaxin-121-like, partial [Trifolium medium]|nr:syntaxin-121-like [Trifolium medium]
ELEKSLLALHQVFLDMTVLVHFQGEQLDDIESRVARVSTVLYAGSKQLRIARKHHKNTRKWICYCIILLVIIVLFVVLFTVKPWQHNDSVCLLNLRD